MRDSYTLDDLGEISTLLQYLYMDEGHAVEVENSIGVPLRITMTDNLGIMLDNLNFPDIPAHEDDISVNTWLAVIGQLKEAPVKDTAAYKTNFKNRWEEISGIVGANLYLNRPNK